MNLNTGFFAAYNHRRKQVTIAQTKSPRSSIESTHNSESFLPSITTMNSGNDGHKPYRRNDFANNHLFIAKQRLARIFLNQPMRNIQSKSDLIHLFDQQDPKQKNRRLNKRQEKNSDSKSIPSLDQDAHLSVVNLTMKPSVPSSQTRDRFSHRRGQTNSLQTKVPRPSVEWINPVIKQQNQSTFEDDFESNMIINELLDNNSDVLNSTINPLGSSVLYVKSIIPPIGLQHH